MDFTFKPQLDYFSDDELIAELSRRDDERNHEEVVEELATHMLRNPSEVSVEQHSYSVESDKMTYTIEFRK